MRGRILLAKWGFLLGTGTVGAQLPPFPLSAPPSPQPAFPNAPAPSFPGAPPFPATQPQPNPLPPLRQGMPAQQPGAIPPGFQSPIPTAPTAPGNPIAQAQEVPLPQPERKFPLDSRDVSLKRAVGAWQLWVGQKLLRDFGDHEQDARDVLRVLKDLGPTEWATIGSPKPIVEYGLRNGRAPMTLGAVGQGAEDPSNPGVQVSVGGNFNGPAVTGAGARAVIPIDLRTVRVEAVRGVWCLRDDDNIHFNFGPVKADAEQALAVVRRYGFNRVGVVGQSMPIMSYFFVGGDAELPQRDRGPLARASLQAQIDGLTRVGIPVPGVGFVGEMTRIDTRKLDARKDGGEWVVVSGTDVLGRFGPTEWAARDAVRTMGEARFTEYCKLGSAGVTFFLVNGKAPTRVPFSARGRRFDPAALKVEQVGAGWAVTERGRTLFDCAGAEEGETLIRVIRHFGFDQTCHIGPTPRQGVSFLAKWQ